MGKWRGWAIAWWGDGAVGKEKDSFQLNHSVQNFTREEQAIFLGCTISYCLMLRNMHICTSNDLPPYCSTPP